MVLGNNPVYLDNLSPVAKRGSYPLDLRFTRDSPQYLLERRPCNRISLKEQDIEFLSAVLARLNLGRLPVGKESISDSEVLFGHLCLLEKAIRTTTARKDSSTTLELGRMVTKLLSNVDLVMPEDGPTAQQTRLTQRLPLLIARELLMQNSDAWEFVRALEAGKESGNRHEPRMLNSFLYITVGSIRQADEINARLRYTTTEWQDRMSNEARAEDKFQESSLALSAAVKNFAETKESIPDYEGFEVERIKEAESGPHRVPCSDRISKLCNSGIIGGWG